MAKILVIDDDAPLARMIATTLRADGFDVATAPDGRNALEQIEHTCPDVIVLDLAMPLMDGREFYHTIRARGIATPVLILSAYGARSARSELGAEAFMPKPFDPSELSTKLQDLVSEAQP